MKLLIASICFFLSVGQYEKVSKSGDMILGAIFAVHNLGEGDSCGKGISDQLGFQRLEAFLFSLKKVNNEILNKKGEILFLKSNVDVAYLS